jgi:hypothetical protein
MTSAWSICRATAGRCPCFDILIRFDEVINRFDALRTHNRVIHCPPVLRYIKASTLYVHVVLLSSRTARLY